MKEEIAVELLKIAAQLTATTLESKIDTSATNSIQRRTIEMVFGDCVKNVEEHFQSLSGGPK